MTEQVAGTRGLKTGRVKREHIFDQAAVYRIVPLRLPLNRDKNDFERVADDDLTFWRLLVINWRRDRRARLEGEPVFATAQKREVKAGIGGNRSGRERELSMSRQTRRISATS